MESKYKMINIDNKSKKINDYNLDKNKGNKINVVNKKNKLNVDLNDNLEKKTIDRSTYSSKFWNNKSKKKYSSWLEKNNTFWNQFKTELLFRRWSIKRGSGWKIWFYVCLAVFNKDTQQLMILEDYAQDLSTAFKKTFKKSVQWLQWLKHVLPRLEFPNHTIFYEQRYKLKNVTIFMKPSFKDTGIIACDLIKKIFKLIGIYNASVKIIRGWLKTNVVKCIYKALLSMRWYEDIMSLNVKE